MRPSQAATDQSCDYRLLLPNCNSVACMALGLESLETPALAAIVPLSSVEEELKQCVRRSLHSFHGSSAVCLLL